MHIFLDAIDGSDIVSPPSTGEKATLEEASIEGTAENKENAVPATAAHGKMHMTEQGDVLSFSSCEWKLRSPQYMHSINYAIMLAVQYCHRQGRSQDFISEGAKGHEVVVMRLSHWGIWGAEPPSVVQSPPVGSRGNAPDPGGRMPPW